MIRVKVDSMQRMARRAAILAVFLCAAAAATAQTPAASAPADPPVVKLKAGQTVTLDDLLDNYADRFGIIFVKPAPMPEKITLIQDVPADITAAISDLNDILAQRGQTTWRVRRQLGPAEASSGRILLQILSIKEAKLKERDESPVTSGTDPGKIDISERDRIVTHIVAISDPQLVESAGRVAASEKDVTVTVVGTAADGFQLILTGPALGVRKSLASVVALDKPVEKVTPITRTIHLDNLDAAGSADTVNQLYGPAVLGVKAVRAVSDKRTNTVILTGPEAEVFHAMGDLTLQDQGPLPAPEQRPVPGKPGALAPDANLRILVQTITFRAIGEVTIANANRWTNCTKARTIADS